MFLGLWVWVSLFVLPNPPPKPKLVITVRPQVGFAPLQIQVIAKVEDYGQEFPCPSIRYIWGDVGSSLQSAYCDPYDQQEERPLVYMFPPRWHTLHTGGDYNIEVVVESSLGDRLSQTKTIKVVGRQLREP